MVVDNFGGISKLYYAEVDWLELFYDENKKVLIDGLQFKPNKFWVEIPFIYGKGSFQEKDKLNSYGETIEVNIKTKVSGVEQLTNPLLKGAKKFVVLIYDHNSRYRLLGTPDFPLQFSKTKSNNAKVSGDNIYNITFKGEVKSEGVYLTSIGTTITVPAIPTNLTATHQQQLGHIRLLWEDNSNIETGFEVWRKQTNGDYVLITTLPANTVEYHDENLNDGVEYTYRVRAVQGNYQSDYSNPATLSTISPLLSFFMSASNGTEYNFEALTNGNDNDLVWEIDGEELTGGEQTKDDIEGFLSVDLFDLTGNQNNVHSITINDINITGSVRTSNFTNLKTFHMINSNAEFSFGASIKQDDISYDLTNTIITADRLERTINTLILANGGDAIADENGNYNAGENHANRTLSVGTITIDISPTGLWGELYKKITALEAVGWTITTIRTTCRKEPTIISSDGEHIDYWLEKVTDILIDEMEYGDVVNLTYELYFNNEVTQTQDLKGTGLPAILSYIQTNSEYADYYDNAVDREQAKDFYLRITPGTQFETKFIYVSEPHSERPCGFNRDVKNLESVASYSYNELSYSYSGFYVKLKNNLNDEREFYGNDLPSIRDWANNINPQVLIAYDHSGNDYHLTPFQNSVFFNINNGNFIFGTGSLQSLLSFANTTDFSIVIKGVTKSFVHNADLVDYDHGRNFPNCAAFVIQSDHFSTSINGTFNILQGGGLNIGRLFDVLNEEKTIGIIIDNENGLLSFYRNNQFISSKELNGQIIYDERLLTVGGFGGGGRFWNGELNALIFYKKAISEQELSAINNILN